MADYHHHDQTIDEPREAPAPPPAADYHHHDQNVEKPREAPVPPPAFKVEENEPVEASDRGIFGFGKNKEEIEEKIKFDEDAAATEFENKVKVCDEKEEPKEEGKKHESLLDKLHRSNSSSSSSSDEEEVGEGGEKKKKKKGLKDKLKEKASGDKKEGGEKAEPKFEETSVPIEKFDEVTTPEEKKGFLDKIKEKFPGGKKPEEVSAPPHHKAEAAEYAGAPETEGKEKKGFLDKIKEKLPGYHSKSDEEKEKEKAGEAYH